MVFKDITPTANRPLLEPAHLSGDDLVLLFDPAHIDNAEQRPVQTISIYLYLYLLGILVTMSRNFS